MNRLKDKRISLSLIEEEYQKNPLTDDDFMYRLKEVIDDLDPLDRAILILYADEESMAKTGVKFGVSPATIYNRIKQIRQIIKDKL